ncbi:MAG TPA: GatB/YqeY domain-containing protein [Vicinamibacterales bacterium]|nr:GatB/YqeY domain-containing protein [Vicinamibacterales bacterium]
MSLESELGGAIAAAMKARDQTTLSALRMLKAALTTKSVEKGRPLSDEEAIQVVNTLVKQRRDSIEQFRKGGRPDLAEKEAAEIAVLERYLPPAATPEDIAAAVDQAIAAAGAASAKDIGKVMKEAMSRLAGKSVDGRAVNEAVRARLSR